MINEQIYIKLLNLKKQIVDNCIICKGKGFVLIKDEKFRKKCKCFKEFLRIKKWTIAQIPQTCWNFKLEELVEQKGGNSIEVYWKFRKYIKHLSKAREIGLGLLLAGSEESGKTFLACYVLKEALRRGFSAEYIRFEDYLFQVKSFTLEDLAKIKNNLIETDFLVIDGIGSEYHKVGSTFAISELIGLYKKRELENKPTILTTSLSRKEVIQIYGKSSSILFSSSLKPIEILRPNFNKEILDKKWESLKTK